MDQSIAVPQRLPVKVITVSGGKGGVGKTNVSVNMAVALAEQGKKVILFDADLGLANVDVLLGLRVKQNLAHVIAGQCSLDEVLVTGPKGIRIIPASSGTQSMTALSPMEHAGLIRAFSSMKEQADILIVDTAAGIADTVLSFARAAQDVLLVVCDEPTSITDAYALIKVLSNQHGVYRFRVLANMVRTPREAQDLFAKLVKVTERFLGNVILDLVGAVPFDENVRRAVKKQKVLLEAFPGSPAALALKGLARKVLTWPIPNCPSGHVEFFIERLVQPEMDLT